DSLMAMSVQIMSHCRYLLRIGIVAATHSDSGHRWYEKHDAVIVGHMVRLTKLYDGIAYHVAQKEAELAMVFQRMIFECSLRVEYLISSPEREKSCESFIFTSFRPEREELADLLEKERLRPLIPIEQRMKQSMEAWLNREGITLAQLRSNRSWNVDGINARDMMKKLGYADKGYPYMFGNASHFVHGDWLDIAMHHLHRNTNDENRYLPKLEYREPDPRISGPITRISLTTLHKYVSWSGAGEREPRLPEAVRELHDLVQKVDSAHEQRL
ncbi:MAG: DUF5677 domain-containing protein, partial [Chloroflexota bacterium]|nr:DUF5677 domain-containing protein [Chloroflexota bacterium]